MNKIIFALLVVLFAPAVLQAHPPKAITVEFDNGTKELAVTISHYVDDPVRHHIEKIVVELNGEEIITQKLKVQEIKGEQRALYLITDAVEGDSISVTGYCSIAGKKKVTIDVVAPENKDTEE